MRTTSMLQSRTMTALSEPFLNTKWRLRTSAKILTEPGFASLKHQLNLHVVGVAGFARPWSRLSLGGAHLVQVVSDARATICHVLADRQRRHGRRLVMASGATKQGVLQLAYEVCAFLSIAAMGIAPDQALNFPLGRMRYMLPFGSAFGDESPAFIRAIDELIVLGGGPQSQREVFLAAQAQRPITIIQGFGGIADQLSPALLPGACFITRVDTSGAPFS